MVVRRILVVLLVLAAFAGSAATWWLHASLKLRSPVVDVSIEAGNSARVVAQNLVDAGVETSAFLLYGWFRLSGQSRQIKAGSYEIESNTTPITLLNKLVRGEEALRAVTLVEGWTFRQVREALLKSEHLVHDTKDLEPDLIMQKLGKSGVHPEGRFFPDTYTYSKGSNESTVLTRALRAMDKHLDAAWRMRTSESPLKSATELLTLASIIEKETGRTSDRALISSVFNNRLRIGMMLQTDPTVIYGLGERFDGNLRRRDLQTDTPWNTYTRAGLPASPIAIPGKAALLAAVQPAPSKALYFVARGDGSSQFSDNLEAHNRAVNLYQRGK